MATVLEAIEAGRWNKALFTTFTLSLSFFESILLRALRQGGCQEVWIITDVQGYKASLIERKSSAIGHDYRVVPVRLTNGVFHPKCAYLWGDKEDALLVGSGNLTFGGFGRNLEVLEVFSSKDSASVFDEFSVFLANVERRISHDLQCPDSTWISTFRQRSRSVGNQATRKELAVRLLHSCERPVVDQLQEILPESDALSVMSPFFDVDGYAVKALADRLKCKHLNVAVAPATKTFNFPFHLAESWKQTVQPAWIDGLNRKRQVHAKWFQIKSKALSAVITGSVNATRQALCTTNNIEVSVLRLANPEESWANWTSSEVPIEFVPTTYTPPGHGEYFAHASLAGGLLRGLILGQNVAGTWQGSLVKPSGYATTFEVEVGSDGSFQLTSNDFSEFALSSGSQIVLEDDERTARGWVHVEDLLRMTRLPKLNLPAFLRIIARENTEEDDIALLEYFAINAPKHLPTFSKKISGIDGGRKSSYEVDDELIEVDLDELAPKDTPTHTNDTSNGQLAELSLERIFTQLRRRLLGHGARKKFEITNLKADENEDEPPDHEPSTDPKDPEPPAVRVARIQSALDLFDHEMRTMIGSPELSIRDQRGLFVLWFEVVMSMLLCRTEDLSRAHKFMSEWASSVARLLKKTSEVDAVEQHFVTSVSFLAPNQEKRTELHEALESFYAGTVDEQRAISALLPTTGVPFGILTKDGISVDLQQLLRSVLASTTIRQHVIALIEGVKNGRPIIGTQSPLFQGGGEAANRELLEHLPQARFKEQIDERPMCANCYLTLPETMAAHLSSRRIAWHKCGWYTVRTK